MLLTDVGMSSQPGKKSTIAKECTLQIQKLVLSHLNSVVAARLLGLVDGLRSSCIGYLLIVTSVKYMVKCFKIHKPLQPY